MANLAEIKKIAAKIHLTLDNPQSVREQLKEVKQAEKQLRQLKQETNRTFWRSIPDAGNKFRILLRLSESRSH